MATAIHPAGTSAASAEPCAWPGFGAIDEGVKSARRAAAAARHAAEELTSDTVSTVRVHPLRAIGVAAFAGAIVGGLTALGLEWARGRRR
jgi:hypothetical protein